MEVETLLTNLKSRYEQVDIPGLAGVSYPPENSVSASPWLVLRQARDIPGRYIRRRARGQMVEVPIEAIILVATNGDQPREEARIDPLIPMVIDAVNPEAWGRDIADILKVDSSEIDHLFTEATVERRPVEWGTQYCYAAYITFDAVIRRQPKPLEIREVTP